MTERIRKENLLKHLQALVGDRNAFTRVRQLRKAADYITRQFESFGYRTTTDNVRLLWRNYPNIIAEFPQDVGAPFQARPETFAPLRAGLPQEPLFIIGAHYDTVPGSPGADDNASGVAALLEIARVVAPDVVGRGGPTGRPLRLQFIAFTLEEQNMQGSAHYAGVLSKKSVPVAGMISLEMVGYKSDAPGSQQLPAGYEHLYPNVGNFIGVIGNERSRALVETFVTAMKTVEGLPVESLVMPGNGELLPPTRLSDHSPFWDHGYPALMITDTSWFRNPHYHEPTDTIDTLDLDFMARVADGVTRALCSAVG